MLVLVSLGAGGCAVSKKRAVPGAAQRPALAATLEELKERYARQAAAIRSLNAAVELSPVAGSTYSGLIEEYREFRAFILAERPGRIRVIGQAPVVSKNIFDMVSDGSTFRIFIPSKGKFLVGPTSLERTSDKPIENLRPQHLLDVLFWRELEAEQAVLFEEFDAWPERYFVLTALHGAAAPQIERKVWFDRADLRVSRIQYFGAGGRVVADIVYSAWQADGGIEFARDMRLRRPQEDYELGIRVTRLKANESIAAERFVLEQPPGTELVKLGEGAGERRP